MESDLASTLARSIRALGCISWGLTDACAISFLMLPLNWFCLLSSCLSIHPFKKYGKRSCNWRLRQKYCWVPQPSHLLFPVWQSSFLRLGHGWVYACFDLLFLSNLPVEILIVICIPCQVQLNLLLGLPCSIPIQPDIVPILFPGYLSLLLPPVQLLIALKCETSRSQYSHASLLPSFTWFLVSLDHWLL